MKRLGERIRRKRELLQLKLGDVAQQVGISPSALSQIEKAKAFPSILTLKHIADCLNTTVGELVGENETLSQQPLIRNNEKKFVKQNKSGTKLFLLSHHDPSKQMETYLIEMPEGGNCETIMSSHPGQEFIRIEEGTLNFLLEENEYQLTPGDNLFYNSNVLHQASNNQTSTCRFVWIVTPPNI